MKLRRAEEELADFEIRDLRASVEGKEILKGVTLAINKGEVHAVMGPNGSGKSTLSHTLMGHPGYTVDGGEVTFKGQNVLALPPDERARLGMFLAFQYPVVVPGISMTNFLRTALNAKRGYDGKDKSKQVTPKEFRSLLKAELGVLIITHYTRILEFIKPDYVHVLVDGKFVLSGGPEVAERLETTGYSEWGHAEETTPQEVA